MNPEHCPVCDRILYNRRLSQCGFCGSEIPAYLRFTPEEEAKLDQEMADFTAAREERETERERLLAEHRKHLRVGY